MKSIIVIYIYYVLLNTYRCFCLNDILPLLLIIFSFILNINIGLYLYD